MVTSALKPVAQGWLSEKASLGKNMSMSRLEGGVEISWWNLVSGRGKCVETWKRERVWDVGKVAEAGGSESGWRERLVA